MNLQAAGSNATCTEIPSSPVPHPFPLPPVSSLGQTGQPPFACSDSNDPQNLQASGSGATCSGAASSATRLACWPFPSWTSGGWRWPCRPQPQRAERRQLRRWPVARLSRPSWGSNACAPARRGSNRACLCEGGGGVTFPPNFSTFLAVYESSAKGELPSFLECYNMEQH